MAASQEPINGSDYVVEISTDGSTWTGLAFAENASLSRAKEEREVTNKYSGGYKELGRGGKKSWEMSSDGFTVYDDPDNRITPDTLHEYWEQDNHLWFRFTHQGANVGDYRYTGKGSVRTLDENSGTEDSVKYTIAIAGSGELNATEIT